MLRIAQRPADAPADRSRFGQVAFGLSGCGLRFGFSFRMLSVGVRAIVMVNVNAGDSVQVRDSVTVNGSGHTNTGHTNTEDWVMG